MTDTPTDGSDVHKIEEELVRLQRQPVSEEKVLRFYDRLRDQLTGYLGKKGKGLGKSAEFLLFVPDVFILLWRLTTDSRVTGKDKVLLGTGIAYFILPIDLLPEALLGPIGYLDDLVFAAYILHRMLNDTDEAILRQHWSGSGDVLDMIRRVLGAADGLVSGGLLKKVKKLIKE
jgi:uncharacterized membrane protein YkvA (DUF1232 family)